MIYYDLEMKSDDFYKIIKKVTIYNLKTSNEYMQFTTTIDGLEKIKNLNLEYSLLNKVNPFLSILSKKGLIIGMVLMMLILYINFFRVSEIKFNDYYPINDEIELSIKNSYKKLFFIDISNQNLSKLSYDLRCKYPSYAYIDVSKKGSDILVNISNDNYIEEKNEVVKPCDIIATKSGIINNYIIYNGTPQINANKYVKKGDILVSGNINQNKTNAKGYIFASVYDEYQIEIKKEIQISNYSNNTIESLSFECFEKDFYLEKKVTFTSYDVKKECLFSFFGIFNINKYTYSEKNDIIKVHSYNDAIKNAYAKIDYDFELYKVHKEEEILEKHLLLDEEDENSYRFRILVLKNMQIGATKEIA